MCVCVCVCVCACVCDVTLYVTLPVCVHVGRDQYTNERYRNEGARIDYILIDAALASSAGLFASHPSSLPASLHVCPCMCVLYVCPCMCVVVCPYMCVHICVVLYVSLINVSSQHVAQSCTSQRRTPPSHLIVPWQPRRRPQQVAHAYVHRYMHTYMHRYMHTYLHTYVHTYIHTYVHTYIRTYIHIYIHACNMHACACTRIHIYLSLSLSQGVCGRRPHLKEAVYSKQAPKPSTHNFVPPLLVSVCV